MSSTRSSKKEFLELLERDREFRYAVAGLPGLGEILGVAKVERWVFKDESGEVHGYPGVVEVDVVVRDDVHILIEAESSESRGDIVELWRVGRLYEEVVGVKPRLVAISPHVDERAFEAAIRLGVGVYTRLG